MIMIVICHMLQYYDNEAMRWFNVGVQIFFVISGFLYGSKDVHSPILFLKKAAIKIFIPYYLFIFTTAGLYYLYHPDYITPNSFIRALTCSGTIKGLGHLWFVGYILFCYMTTPYLYWYREYIGQYSNSKKLIAYLLFLVFFQIICIAFDSFFIPDRISCYIIGYFLADIFSWNDNPKKYFVHTMIIVSAVFMNGVEIFGRYVSNDFVRIIGATPFNAICRYGHCMLGVSLFIVLMVIFKNINRSHLMDFSDKYSYSIYIVHLLFVLSPFSLMQITSVTVFNWTLVVISVLLTGIMLNKTSELIKKKIFH